MVANLLFDHSEQQRIHESAKISLKIFIFLKQLAQRLQHVQHAHLRVDCMLLIYC